MANLEVEPSYFIRVHSGQAIGLIFDLADAYSEAQAAADEGGKEAIRHILFEFFQHELLGMTAQGLIDYLESRQVWKRYRGLDVYKTIDEPCLAYTAQTSPKQLPGCKVMLIGVGLCYRYPRGSIDSWWNEVIKQRVEYL